MIVEAFITAVRTLTRLRMPGKGAENDAHSLCAFPVVGAIVGGFVTLAVWLIGGLLEWGAGAGVAGVLVGAWVTGGLHLDGLGDAVDGLYGGRTWERRLDIMKDTHMGAFGVIAVALAILIKAVSLAKLALLSEWRWIPVPFILSRLSLVLLAVRLPYARREGGTAEVIVENARAWHFIAAMVLALAGCWLLTGGMGLAAFVLSFVLTCGIVRWMRRAFGGVTGDLLGMANEIVECTLLFTVAAVLPLLHVPEWIQRCPALVPLW